MLSDSPPDTASERRSRSERRLLAAALLVVAALLVWARVEGRQAIDAMERARLAGQARAVEQNLARQLRGIHAALVNIRDDLPGWPAAERAPRAGGRLQALSEAVPGLQTMQWVGADGNVRATSHAGARASVANLERARARPDPVVLFVSPPFASAPGGPQTLELALALTDAKGEFDGLLAATLDAEYLQVVLGSVNYADDMWAAVIHGDGRVLALNPPEVGRRAADAGGPGSAFSRHIAGGEISSVVEGHAPGSSELRLVAQRTLWPAAVPMDRPLVLSVSRSVLAVYAPWRRQGTIDALLVLLFGGAASLGLVTVQRRRAEVERLTREQQARQAADAERLELALRGADLALWDAHLPTGTSTVNARWHTMLGYEPGEKSSDEPSWLDLIHPDDLDAVLAAQQAHVEGRTPSFDLTYRLRHRDGHWVWVLDRGRVVERAPDGTAIRMVGTHMDVTERLGEQEALRRNEESLAITLHSIGDAVIATDAEGRVTRMNDTAQRLTGWPLDEARGRPLAEVFRLFVAATREPAVDPVARVLADGAKVDLADGTLLVARDGTEVQVADSAAPIRAAGGAIVGVVLVFSDVTEQYRTVQALRDREAQLAAITDALPGPVWRVDRSGRLLFANKAYERWFGVPAARLLGRTRAEVHGDDDVERLRPGIDCALDGSTRSVDAAVRTAEGLRHALLTVVPDRDAAGAVRGAIVVVTDITERQRAEDALRLSELRSRSVLGALISGVVVHGPRGEVLDANPAACRILGMTLDELRGDGGADAARCFLEEDGTPMAPERYPVNQVIASGQALHHFVTGIRRPAMPQPLWVYCNALPLRDAQGALQEVVLTLADFSERKAAEEQLRASEARLRMSGRLARLGAWKLQLLPRLRLSLAPEMAAILHSDLALDAPAALRLVARADRRRWHERIKAVRAGASSFDDEARVASPRGGLLYLRVLGEPVRDAAERVVALQGAVQDVTAARLEQQQLRLLEACVARLNDVVLVTEVDPRDEPTLRIVFVNAAFERLWGWRRDEVLGRSPRLLQGPATDAGQLDRISEAMRQDQSVRAELQFHAADGTAHWVETEIVPVAGTGRRASHFVAVQRDISDRKRSEAAVQAAQDELAATLQAVPDALFDLDLEGRIHAQHTPRPELMALPPEPQIGRTVAEIMPPEPAAAIAAALQEAHAKGRSNGMQYELPLPAGPRGFELSVATKPAPAGALPRFIAVVRDITERKLAESARVALERQLQEAQKMESIGTLAGGIAHDFNNILAAILGNVALASDDLPPEHPARVSLEQISRAGLRARNLVQQILTFSRRQPNELRAQPLRPVVEETLSLLRATLPASARLDTVLADDPLPVEADATQLQQVVMNLCTNAWHALPGSRGRIEVGLAALSAEAAARLRLPELQAGPCVHLWVADNGTGIEADVRERIFDPFFTTKPVGQGTGLGLSVVHGIVRGHRGAVAVDSVPGHGSTFHVYLPLVGAARGSAGDGAAGSAPAARASGHRVLYVDDDEIMLTMVQRLLERDGWDVVACGEPAQALRLVEVDGAHYDIVITDYNMPDMSGLELAQQIAGLRPALPLVITTGYLTDDLREHAEAAGVRVLLRKENTLEELPALLQRLLAPAVGAGS